MCKPIAGARESNAGDDFHLVWAAKKALALLEPNTNFKALSVEGPSLEDERNFEIDSKDLLSIDVAEYYGDKTFETASNVIFSQLKYSTRNANKDWTLANLCTPTNKKKDNSIIRRLAQTLAPFVIKSNSSFDLTILNFIKSKATSTNSNSGNEISSCLRILRVTKSYSIPRRPFVIPASFSTVCTA